MSANNLNDVVQKVVQRAQMQGYVVPDEVRAELAQAHLARSQWKEVLKRARHWLRHRSGRYYYIPPDNEQAPAERSSNRTIPEVVRALLKQHRGADRSVERRGEERVDIVLTVKVLTEDNRELTLLSRDLSPTGIRLFGTHRLLGEKVRVLIPAPSGTTHQFLVRILWTCPVGDDLVENGGAFLLEQGCSISSTRP
jgi:hypothetical protein